MFRENGIYAHLIIKALNPRRIGPDVDKKQVKQEINSIISMNQMRGIFILYLIFTSFTFILLIFELIKIRALSWYLNQSGKSNQSYHRTKHSPLLLPIHVKQQTRQKLRTA